ncbi:lytic transglycosylase domain-containing protein [Aestuariibius sp. HNIBRBA575]|uniref:lytic transglycosylase domain-containing protein n=1 Tax=Aestuariibius sp. HNIBRBA575 TaxID=3233343 RepID=UPI0034A23774
MALYILYGLSLAVGLSSAALADSHRLQPDFTFRSVGVPEPGSTAPRITVQIAPSAPSGPAAPNAAGQGGATAAAPQQRPPGEYDWFWETISPDVSESGPGRLDPALAAIRAGSVPQPRLATLQGIASTHGLDILRATVGTDVSPALALAVISVESAGQSDAVSGAGAAGLMQLMPATAERFGVTDRMNSADNIKGGVAYLAWLMDHFDKDPILVLAAYNAGEGSVRDNSGVPPYAETRAYVPKVLAAWSVARGLCITPPQLITDGCVFSVN